MSQTLHLVDGKDPKDQDQRVFIATPCYTGDPSGIYVFSLLKTINMLEKQGIGWEWCFLMHNCHVDDSRNTLVRNFRGSECTDLLFIDADNGWSYKDVYKILKIDREFVAGVYPKKSFDDDFPCDIESGKDLIGEPDPYAEEGVIEVIRVPTGFMRLRRSVIDKLVDSKHGQRRYAGGDQTEDTPPSVILFERTYEDDRRWGGDWAFCNKWRDIGGKIYIDPTMTFQHTGPWTWEGSQGKQWKKMYGVTLDENSKAIGEYLAKLEANPSEAAQDIESLVSLYFKWDNPWSLPPEQMSTVITLALQSDGPSLECGSGLSTVLLAHIAKLKGRKHYALENNMGHSAKTYAELRQHKGLTDHVEIIPADLKYNGEYEFYEIPDHLPKDIGFMLVDGPPRTKGTEARCGVMHELKDNLAPGCLIHIDDVASKGFQDAIEEWNRTLGTEFTVMKGTTRRFAVGRIPAKERGSAA